MFLLLAINKAAEEEHKLSIHCVQGAEPRLALKITENMKDVVQEGKDSVIHKLICVCIYTHSQTHKQGHATPKRIQIVQIYIMKKH